jgi:hypothetical protein
MKQVDRPFYLDCNNPRRNSSLAYSLACGAFVATTGYPGDTVHTMLSISQIVFCEITGNVYTVLPRRWQTNQRVFKGIQLKVQTNLQMTMRSLDKLDIIEG